MIDPDAHPHEERDDIEDFDEESSRRLEPVSYFGTDFDVHGLVRRLNAGEVVIPSFDPRGAPDTGVAGFQRRFVWSGTQMNRFVESLLLGFPVPGIFLVQQPDKKLLVLDGQQRLKTLQSFFAGNFALEGVVDAFAGRRYLDLSDEDRRLLDNTFIHATIVKYEPGSAEAIYQLFERLNTGGTNLYPHEIRVALYGGKLVELVRDLNAQANWRNLYGDLSSRLKDHELILRFVALYYDADKYERPLKTFLNSFTKDHRNLEGLQKAEIERLFGESCNVLWEALGRSAFRLKSAINAALVDAVMIGIARRIAGGPRRPQPAAVKDAHDCLLQNQEFLVSIGRATADEERVRQRLKMATDAFAGS